MMGLSAPPNYDVTKTWRAKCKHRYYGKYPCGGPAMKGSDFCFSHDNRFEFVLRRWIQVQRLRIKARARRRK